MAQGQKYEAAIKGRTHYLVVIDPHARQYSEDPESRIHALLSFKKIVVVVESIWSGIFNSVKYFIYGYFIREK